MINTSDFSYFCSPSEAHALIGSVLDKYKDILLFYNDRGNEIDVFEDACFYPEERVVWARFLENSLASDIGNYLNAIQFIFPARSNAGLLMGVIAIKYDDRGRTQFSVYNKIKRKMLKSLRGGVCAINRIDGASRIYKDIYYSECAKRISCDGIDLLSRYGDGNIYYKIA